MKQVKENLYHTPFILWLVLIIITSAYSLSGCSRQLDASLHEDARHNTDRVKEVPGASFLGLEVIPLQMSAQEEFYKASGWVSDSEVLYISNNSENTSLLYLYNLLTGKKKLLYKSEHPIIAAEVSPKKEKVLIHSSASDKGILTVIDFSGRALYSVDIESYELTFEWNPYDENLLVISAFSEEWDFSTHLLDLRESNMKELHLPEPFVRWITEDVLAYQQWDEDGISLKAPLKAVSVSGEGSETLFEEVYQFDSIGRYLLTIQVENGENPGFGLYSFTRDGGIAVAEFTAPFLTSYSGWVVPYYDLIEDEKVFMYFRAKEQGEADLYNGGFDLLSYDLGAKKEEMIFSELSNEPLSCSPSGKMCLYGFQLERVLNIETKEIIELVK
ncbi:YqgU-like beta propeller domain-containing protein [Mesobacillus jeotgali]|uniref:YqgU-like beta propeller domain-containing protein n=1 Tax=Mesobacillus jeotgali TaxID=129985 RepID=UPI0009A6162D|nr:hypothetical protein [Mesobacillus jeotgali]